MVLEPAKSLPGVALCLRVTVNVPPSCQVLGLHICSITPSQKVYFFSFTSESIRSSDWKSACELGRAEGLEALLHQNDSLLGHLFARRTWSLKVLCIGCLVTGRRARVPRGKNAKDRDSSPGEKKV